MALARMLVDTAQALDRRASALITDMSQPLGEWAGHTAEVRAAYDGLEGRGDPRLMEVTLALCEEAARLVGHELSRGELDAAIASGAARERLERWAAAQGADPGWLRRPSFPLAPEEVPLRAPRSGRLTAIDTRQLGMLLGDAGGGRTAAGEAIDLRVALRSLVRLGDPVAAGDELARLYLRRDDPALVRSFAACYRIDDQAEAPPPVLGRVE
jgi:thymidine phosphorylase